MSANDKEEEEMEGNVTWERFGLQSRRILGSKGGKVVTGCAFGYFPMLSKEPRLVTSFQLVTVCFLDHMTLLSCDALCLMTASASLWGT